MSRKTRLYNQHQNFWHRWYVYEVKRVRFLKCLNQFYANFSLCCGIGKIPLFYFPSVQCPTEYLNGLIWLPTYFLANLLWAHNGLALAWEFIATKKENLDWITCQLAKLPQFISFEQIGKKTRLEMSLEDWYLDINLTET